MRKFIYVGQVNKMIVICMLISFLLGVYHHNRYDLYDHTDHKPMVKQSTFVEKKIPHFTIHHVINAKEKIELPAVAAKAAALVDVTSGRVLYSHQGTLPLPMASTTKVMTAIVAIEHGRLDDIVKTTKRAVGKEGSSLYLRLGEEMSLHHLLYGLMLRSGNDAAVAIAEHVGGSEEGFVYLMNEKAKLLGLEQTQFRNPHGLDEAGHYTTALDLAHLSAYALHNDTFKEIVRTRIKKVPNSIDKWNYQWLNKNKMLHLYEGADGVKTGYTSKALRCLVSSATRNGQQLVAVTLNDARDWEDHKKMFDYGFRMFPLTSVVKQGQKIAEFSYQAAETFLYPLAAGERKQVTAKSIFSPTDHMTSHVRRKGRLVLSLHKKTIGSVPLQVIRKER